VALHATNLVLHAVASVLVWCLATTAACACRQPRPGISGTASEARAHGRVAGFLALAFFLVAPVHEEAVGWISARGHVLVTIFALGALLLMRRFWRTGGLGWYIGSLGATIAAFLTQELAVALPALLLLRDVFDPPTRSPARLVRLHAPFWLLLAGYLGLRLAAFGKLTRQDEVPGAAQTLHQLYTSLWAAWFGPTLLAEETPHLAALGLVALTGLIIAWPAVLSFGRWTTDGGSTYVRAVIYFAGVWPLVTVAPLLGAAAQRHLYFASVGIAVALGLAGARLLAIWTRTTRIALGAVGAVFVIHGLLLVSGIGAFARNGDLSQQLMAQFVSASDQTGTDPAATVVVLPEVPGNERHLWEYALPVAADPLFLQRPPPPSAVSSFSSCHCQPAEWLADNGPALTRLTSGAAEPVYVIEWQPDASAFTTRLLTRAQFRAAYLQPGGPFLRPRRPDLPAPDAP
jgi:hypothetical protein